MKDEEKTKEKLIEELESLRLRVAELEDAQIRLKNTEQTLRESEERFQSFMTNSPAIAFMKDDEGRFLYVNQRWEEEFDRALPEVQGMLTEEVWPGKPGIEYRKHDRKVLDSGKAFEFLEKSFQADNGVRYWCTFRFPMQDSKGQRCTGGVAVEITNQKKAEQALAESEERLQLALSGADLGLWDWDLRTGKVTRDERTAEIYGYPPAEMDTIFEMWESVVHPADKPEVLDKFKRHLEGSTPFYDAEYRLSTKSGETKWVLARGKVSERDSDGKPLRVSGTLSDITDRKTAEGKIRQQSEFLTSVLESITNPFYVVNADDYTIEIANSAATSIEITTGLTCYSATRHTTQPCGGLDHACPLEEVKKTKRPMTVDHVHFRKDGSVRNIAIHAFPVLDCEGNVKQVIKYGLDVTDHKQAHEALRIRDQALKKSINAIHFANPDGKTIFVNDSFVKMWGFQGIDDALGIHISELHPDKDAFSKVFATFEEKGYYLGELQGLRRDGTTFDLLLSASLVLDDSGKPACFMASFLDITDRKQAEEALRRSKDELELRVQERTAELETMNEELLREIAERMAAEEELREGEELLTAVLDALPDVVGVLLPDYSITRYNRAGYDLLGLEPNEVHGRKCYELIGRSEPCDRCATRTAVKTKRPESLEKFVTALGRHLWCTSSPLLDPSGEVRLVIERLVDITERKKAEEALGESEAKYRFLTEHASDVLWTLDMNLRTTYVSPSIERVLGFTPEERMKQDVRDQLTPESYAIAQKRLVEELRRDREEGIASREYAVLELNYLHKDGSVVCLESVMSFIWDENGKPIGIYGLSRDITERRKSEEALRRSEEFNRRLVEFAPFGIAYLARDGTVEYINPEASRTMGVPEGRISPVLGRNFLELPGLKDPSEIEDGFRRLLKGESLSSLELAYRSSAGIDTELLIAAAPRVGSDGAVTGAILMFTDISERKKAEGLRHQTARFKAVADLSNGVAHNFNNLLHVVIGYLELALMDLEARNYPVVRDALEKVLKSSRLGAEVVRRLQTFSRDRQPFQVSEKGVFDLSDVARQAADVSQAWVTTAEKEGRAVCLHTRLNEGCFVNADQTEIFDVVANLVRNAVEALYTDGDVDLTTAVEGNKVVLHVRDTGIGIGQENLGRVFNPFFTTKAESGAGLSLASGRKIVEDCGGEILVDSVEGQGTTFTVSFPLAKHLPDPTKVLPERDTENPLTILAIDDMEAITDFMKSVLTQYGHAVLTALSGEEGIEILKDNPADVVICDLGMPGMSGWEVGKRIRAMCQERGVPKTPFILLTAWAGQEMEAGKIAHSGVDAVVAKPLKIQDIREVIQEVVEKGISRDSGE
jgi:PAS domain S-box-containing protein